MTRSSPILYWVLGLLVLCAVLGFYNGFRTATHRDTPSWAGGSTLSTNPGQAAVPGVDPPEAQPLAPDNPAGIAPVQTAPVVDKPKPKADDDADQPDETDKTTATPLGEPKPIALPPPAANKPAAADKPAASDKPAADRTKAAVTATPAKPKPAPPPPAEAPPPAQQPQVPY